MTQGQTAKFSKDFKREPHQEIFKKIEKKKAVLKQMKFFSCQESSLNIYTNLHFFFFCLRTRAHSFLLYVFALKVSQQTWC